MVQAQFQQAGIPVQKEAEYQDLRAVLERTFARGTVEKFLRRMKGDGIGVRNFEKALARRHFEKADQVLAKSGKRAVELYAALPVSDQAQIRELYLTLVEKVDDRLRGKYREIY